MDVLLVAVRRRQGWSDEAVIRVNGIDLVDLVEREERPFAEREGHPGLAGFYIGLLAGKALLPSRHLLGSPDEELSSPAETGGAPKAALLMCGCREVGCSSVCALVEVDDVSVRWSEFEQQPQRRRYDALGPYLFDRRQYEAALRRPVTP